MKPSFFKNEMLATSDPLNAWVFEGLWCMADREGRLEDRPRRIHLEINPGRAYEGTEAALAWLTQHGFVIRYTHSGSQYIQIVNFTKHQNPHMREPASKIPPPGVSTELAPDNGPHIKESKPESTILAPDKHRAGPALSSFPLPESPSLIPEEDARSARREQEADLEFEALKALYPKRSGDQRWHEARRAINARLAEGCTWNQILDGARRYAAWCVATGKVGTETVKQAATFCGPGKPFLEPWTLPTPPPPKLGWRPDPKDDPPLGAGHA